MPQMSLVYILCLLHSLLSLKLKILNLLLTHTGHISLQVELRLCPLDEQRLNINPSLIVLFWSPPAASSQLYERLENEPVLLKQAILVMLIRSYLRTPF